MNSSEPFYSVINAFINCDDFLESRQMVQQYSSILLSAEGLDQINQLISNYANDEGLLQRLKLSLNVLTKCIDYGYNLAFAKLFLEYYPNEIPDRVANKFARLPSQRKIVKLARAHPEWTDFIQQAAVGNQLLVDLISEIQRVSAEMETGYRIELCRAALQLGDPRIDPATYMGIKGELANSLLRVSGEALDKSVEEAIRLYREILAFYRKTGNRKLEATCLHNLGSTLVSLPTPIDNNILSEALECLESALKTRVRKRYPTYWAQTMFAIGKALSFWHGNEREKQAENAIPYFDGCLEVFTPSAAKYEWIAANRALADIYIQRSVGIKSVNVRIAIKLLNGVVKELNPDSDHEVLVSVGEMLMNAYSYLASEYALAEDEKEEYISPIFDDREWVLAKRWELPGKSMEEWVPKGAIVALWDELITITTWRNAQDMPFKSWVPTIEQGMKQRLVTNGKFTWETNSESEKEVLYEWRLCDDVATDDQYELVRAVRGEKGIYTIHYAQRLKLFDEGHHHSWLTRLKEASLRYDTIQRFDEVKFNYLSSIEVEDFLKILGNETNQKEVNDPEKFFQQTFCRMNRAENPALWATASWMCGLFLLQVSESSGAYIESAIRYFRRSIEVFTRDKDPEMWARDMMNIARCFRRRTEGDKARNFSAFLIGFEQALQVFILLSLDKELADGLQEIGSACFHQSKGTDSHFLMIAEKFYNEALIKRSSETQPAAWAETMVSLGDVYCALNSLNPRGEYYEKANDTYSKVVRKFSSNKPFKTVDRDDVNNFMSYAIQQLAGMDYEHIAKPIIPIGYEERKTFGEILYLRSLDSAGTFLIPNRFTHPESFQVKFDHLPEMLTIDSTLYIALGEKLSFSSLGGRPEGLGASRAYLVGGEGWEKLVVMQMDRSNIIALMPHNSPGVKWEVETIIEKMILPKCLLIMPPASPQFPVASMWAEAAIMMKEFDLYLPDYDGEGLIFRFNTNKEIEESIPFKEVWENTLFDRIRHLLTR